MTFSDNAYQAYITAVDLRNKSTSNCTRTSGSKTTADTIQFTVKLSDTEFTASLFRAEKYIHVELMTPTSNGYDSARFDMVPSGETELERAESVVNEVVKTCQTYLDTIRAIQKSATESIKHDLCNQLAHLIDGEREQDPLLDYIESFVRKELDKYNLVKKCHFNNFYTGNLGIVSAAIGEQIIVKVTFQFHKTKMKKCREWDSFARTFREPERQFIRVDSVTVATRPVDSDNDGGAASVDDSTGEPHKE